MKKSPLCFYLLLLLLTTADFAQAMAINRPWRGEYDERRNNNDPRWNHHDGDIGALDNAVRMDLNAAGGIVEERPNLVQEVPEGRVIQPQGGRDHQQFEILREEANRAIERLRAMQQKRWLDHFIEALGNPLETFIKLKNATVRTASNIWQGGVLSARQRDAVFLRAQGQRLREIEEQFRNQLIQSSRVADLIDPISLDRLNALEAQLTTWIQQEETRNLAMTADQKAQKMIELASDELLQRLNNSIGELSRDQLAVSNLNCLDWSYYLHQGDRELLGALYHQLFHSTYEQLQLEQLQLEQPRTEVSTSTELTLDRQAELMKEALEENLPSQYFNDNIQQHIRLYQTSYIAKCWMDFARFQNASEPLLRNIAYKIFDEENEAITLHGQNNRPLTSPQLSYRLIGVVQRAAPRLNIPNEVQLDYCIEWARSRQGRMTDNEMTTLLNEIRANGPARGLPLPLVGQ